MGSTALMSTNEKKEDHYFYLLFFLFFISFIYWFMFINSFFMRPIKSKRGPDEKSNKENFFCKIDFLLLLLKVKETLLVPNVSFCTDT